MTKNKPMKKQLLFWTTIAVRATLISSCTSNTKEVHENGEAHSHTEVVEDKKTMDKDLQESVMLLDSTGKVIYGCPAHKEMIGSEGDQCPKCNYMELIPVTWSLEGIDTVRVTELHDYNPHQKIVH